MVVSANRHAELVSASPKYERVFPTEILKRVQDDEFTRSAV